MNPGKSDITALLNAWRQGDRVAGDELFAVIQPVLRQLARRQFRQNRHHTLQTTDLVNEAFLRLYGRPDDLPWQDRVHFFAAAATVMRNVLLDYVRRKQRLKRGQGVTYVTLDEALDWPAQQPLDVLALDDALRELERFAPRQSRVVVLRFFGGLSIEETAAALNVAPVTVKRDWNAAQRWLARELTRS